MRSVLSFVAQVILCILSAVGITLLAVKLTEEPSRRLVNFPDCIEGTVGSTFISAGIPFLCQELPPGEVRWTAVWFSHVALQKPLAECAHSNNGEIRLQSARPGRVNVFICQEAEHGGFAWVYNGVSCVEDAHGRLCSGDVEK